MEAGWRHVKMPRREINGGEVDWLQRKANIGSNPIYITRGDRCMVLCRITETWQEPISRPWMILVDADYARTPKRKGVSRYASSQAALREARKIERELMGVPKRARKFTKKAEP